jgi:hypothetical protein
MDPRPTAASPFNLLAPVSDDGWPGKKFQISCLLDVDQEEPDLAHPWPARFCAAQRLWQN